MSLASFGVQDFVTYFSNSFILDPETGKPAYCIGAEMDNITLAHDSKHRKFTHVPISKFTWACAKYPELGYRNVDKEGSAVVWLARKPGRVTRKGLRADTIAVSYPECLNAISRFSPTTPDQLATQRNGWALAELVHSELFVKPPEAIARLLSDKDKAVALAIDAHFAITLWPLKEHNLALFYAGQRSPVAMSVDGKTWEWLDICVKDIANRRGIIN